MFFIAYPDSCEDIQSIIRGLGCDTYAYITHDKDINPDTGELKKPHYHVYLEWENAHHFSVVAKAFNIAENNIEKCKSKKGAIRYLLHMDEGEEKYKYDTRDIISNNINLNKYFGDTNECIKAQQIIEIILNNRGAPFSYIVSECCERGLFDVLRRGNVLFLQIYKQG